MSDAGRTSASSRAARCRDQTDARAKKWLCRPEFEGFASAEKYPRQDSHTPQVPSENRKSDSVTGAESGAVDPDLQRVIDAWPQLSREFRAAVLAVLRA